MRYSIVFLPVALLAGSVSAVGNAFGYAAGTTGGGSLTPVEPANSAQLMQWLSDSQARVIKLSKNYDFTDATLTSGFACKPWTCSPNPQVAINKDNWCSNYENLKADTPIKYSASGMSGILVGSNKTLLGVGKTGGITGRGLYLKNSQNVIVQNIRIAEINAQFVWGGDAIAIDGGDRIWLDHNYIQHIGRQHIATGYGAVTRLTISNTVFDGQSTYSATCNGRHYWVAILTGKSDQITFAYNHLYMTSGRGPHVGGTSGYTQKVHLYNNYFNSIEGHAIEPDVGANILAEGNYWNTVTQPSQAGVGSLYFPTTAAHASACQSILGRACVLNTLLNSGAVTTVQTAAVSALNDATVRGTVPVSAQEAATYVQGHAGLGIVA